MLVSGFWVLVSRRFDLGGGGTSSMSESPSPRRTSFVRIPGGPGALRLRCAPLSTTGGSFCDFMSFFDGWWLTCLSTCLPTDLGATEVRWMGGLMNGQIGWSSSDDSESTTRRGEGLDAFEDVARGRPVFVFMTSAKLEDACHRTMFKTKQ